MYNFGNIDCIYIIQMHRHVQNFFVKVRFDPDAPGQTIPNEDFLSDDQTAFITPELLGERDTEAQDDGNEDEEDAPAPAADGLPRRGRM